MRLQYLEAASGGNLHGKMSGFDMQLADTGEHSGIPGRVSLECVSSLEWDRKLLNRHHNSDSLAGYDFLGSPVYVISR